MRKNILYTLIAVFLSSNLFAQDGEDKTIFKAMQDCMNRTKEELVLPNMPKAFYLSYSYASAAEFNVVGELGSIIYSDYKPHNNFANLDLLIGNYQNNSELRFSGAFPEVNMPIDNDYYVIRRNLWMLSDICYKRALQEFAGKQAYLKNKPESPEIAALPDLVKTEPINYVEKNTTNFDIDINKFENLIKDLSAEFKQYKELESSQVNMNGLYMDVYKTTTENVIIKKNLSYLQIKASASMISKEGSRLHSSYSRVVKSTDEIPTIDEIKLGIKNMIVKLHELDNAPKFDEYYSGPVMFEDGTALKVFSSYLLNGQALYGQRMPVGRPAGNNLVNRIGRKVIDSRITIKNYTDKTEYNGKKLYGHYEVDACGVKPNAEMTLVDKGILRQMLCGNFPSVKNLKSTGSSRFISTPQNIVYTVAPGTIHIQVEKGLKQSKMKKALLKAAKEADLKYAFIVRSSAGLLLMYRVDVKNGKETLLKDCELSGLNLQKLEKMIQLSNEENVSNTFVSNGVLSSIIYPKSIILDNIEINESHPQKVEEPSLVSPMERK